jgi:hypothetical protein
VHCAVGSWGGRRLSLGGSVTLTGAHGRGARRRRELMLACMKLAGRVKLPFDPSLWM